jgi:hypothetical protein
MRWEACRHHLRPSFLVDFNGKSGGKGFTCKYVARTSLAIALNTREENRMDGLDDGHGERSHDLVPFVPVQQHLGLSVTSNLASIVRQWQNSCVPRVQRVPTVRSYNSNWARRALGVDDLSSWIFHPSVMVKLSEEFSN